MQAFQKETTLRKSLQKESQQINYSLQYKELYIENGIVLEANGKHLSLKETQALIVKYNKLVMQKYCQNRNISRLQERINYYQET
ncbi:hypothetical protein F8M41_023801 [Gigaspora margarita]|uniref:Uncharacterized protein n=1 Tax=Gigaspora margarita TaxID=4874 RepID=A0A8H4ACS6_GIGMA|nr:hypothetical protein F8M41_023801 [Gigaspora margarita]